MATGDIIAELREDKGLTQEQLADLMKVHRSAISGYETGKYTPELEKLIWLADFFEVSLDYIMCRIRNNIDLKWIENSIGKYDGHSITIGDLIKRIEKLNNKSKNAIIDYLDLLELRENNTKHQ